MNAETAWYLGYREKTSASRITRWLEETLPVARQLEGSSTELGTPLEKFLSRQLGSAPGYEYALGHGVHGVNVRRTLRKALDPDWARKSPWYFGSLEDAKRTIRNEMQSGEVDPLTEPLGRYGLSRFYLRQSHDHPLEELARVESRIPKPSLPDVKPAPFVPLELP